ncbi:MAG: hypothetical protein HDT36_01665 [Clostridiales bacterium]|nr:hypothetical protein [Clostridiales bacterium]
MSCCVWNFAYVQKYGKYAHKYVVFLLSYIDFNFSV